MLIIFNNKYIPFHLVTSSPYPLLVSNSLGLLMIGIILNFDSLSTIILELGIIIMIINIILWLSDIIIESTYLGLHTYEVEKGLSIGIILFIITEVILFISIFWALYHSNLSPTLSIGCIWPPIGIIIINAITIPLLNSIILLSSSISITTAHYSMIARIRLYTINYIIITIFKAIYFIILQYIEYTYNTFTITDSIYGTIFYSLTGLHGIHIIIGLIFIIISLIRIYIYQITDYHHLGIIISIGYWHFVDILWLFVYTTIY